MSPWGKVSVPEPANLQDIMSEELARELQEKKDSNDGAGLTPGEDRIQTLSELVVQEISVEKSDEEIAKDLQQQYVKEYEDILKRSKQNLNISKPIINCRRSSLNFDCDSDSDEDELEGIMDKKDWERFDPILREFDATPADGSNRNNEKLATKYNIQNWTYPTDFKRENGIGSDMEIANRIILSLKMHSTHEQSDKHKTQNSKEVSETTVLNIDVYTGIILSKLINMQVIDKVNGAICTGNEAIILHGETNRKYQVSRLSNKCIIKVFKIQQPENKRRIVIFKKDKEYKEKDDHQVNTKKMALYWAKKEMYNLHRMKKAKIPCPKVVGLLRHILIMSFIGNFNKPAPKLKDAQLDNTQKIIAYKQVVQYMKTLYNKCNLVHGDLSECNILWHDGKCYIMDLSRGLDLAHENAFYFLYDDCERISKFFKGLDVPDTGTADELFSAITGFGFTDRTAQVWKQQSVKMKSQLLDTPVIESMYTLGSLLKKINTRQLFDRTRCNIENLNLVAPIK